MFRNGLYKKKSIISTLMVVFLFAGLLLGAASVAQGQVEAQASDAIKVVINNSLKTFAVNPQIIEGQTMVPYRGIVESLGGQAKWDNRDRSVSVIKGKTALKLIIGKKEARYNGKKISLAVAPVMINGQTLVPLRFIGENLGQQVSWNNRSKTIVIKSAQLNEKQVAKPTVKPTNEKKSGGVVNIYTSRHYGVEPVFSEFTKETGIRIRFTTGPDAALRERIKAEGANTPADIYMAVDAGNLWLAAQDDLLQPVSSETLNKNIPAELRDSKNRWIGLTKRVRTIMYNTERVKASELSTYEDLGNPKWRGRLILRPATHVYNQSLVANLIATYGEKKTEQIVRGWVANDPKYIDSDSRILDTLAAGGADVAITNHYYLARLVEKNPSFPVRAFWANQGPGEHGVHANVSGAGITAHAENKENAIKLLEWLSSPNGQKLFADTNLEYPTNPQVAHLPIIANFGKFIENKANKGDFGRFQADAVKLMDRAGFK